MCRRRCGRITLKATRSPSHRSRCGGEGGEGWADVALVEPEEDLRDRRDAPGYKLVALAVGPTQSPLLTAPERAVTTRGESFRCGACGQMGCRGGRRRIVTLRIRLCWGTRSAWYTWRELKAFQSGCARVLALCSSWDCFFLGYVGIDLRSDRAATNGSNAAPLVAARD